jgi:hypothetical protein
MAIPYTGFFIPLAVIYGLVTVGTPDRDRNGSPFSNQTIAPPLLMIAHALNTTRRMSA